jgi:hypothetical protein
MPNTYELVASNTVGSTPVTSVTFSSIPSTYTDLIVKMSTRTNDNVNNFNHVGIRFNGDAGTNYSVGIIRADGSSAISSGGGATQISASVGNGNLATANAFGFGEVYIFNYTGSNQKIVSSECFSESNETTVYSFMGGSIWQNSSAITSMTLFDHVLGNPFTQYSTFYLYGIKNS